MQIELQDIILEAIRGERNFQDKESGSKNATHTDIDWLLILQKQVGSVVDAIYKMKFKELQHVDTIWYLEKNLIQTAAVCVAWLEAKGEHNDKI